MACEARWRIQMTLSGKGKLNVARIRQLCESTWAGLALPPVQMLEEPAWCVSTGVSEL